MMFKASSCLLSYVLYNRDIAKVNIDMRRSAVGRSIRGLNAGPAGKSGFRLLVMSRNACMYLDYIMYNLSTIDHSLMILVQQKRQS